MKTPEDEAFDELAKRQGHWGGGFPAKRAMAADKLRDCIHGSLARSCQICDLEAEVKELKAALAQPAQEPDALTIAYQSGYYDGKKAALAQPAQEQWNAALDEAANRISEIAAFPKTTQDSFAVFIRGLKK